MRVRRGSLSRSRLEQELGRHLLLHFYCSSWPELVRLFSKRPYNALKEMISDTRTKSICKNLPATLFRVTKIWKRDNPQQVPDAPSGCMTTESP